MPFTAEQKRQAAKLYEQGMSLREVGSKLNCSHVTIRTLLKEMGVPLRRHGEQGAKLLTEIVSLRNGGATFTRIAELLHISREQARRLYASTQEVG